MGRVKDAASGEDSVGIVDERPVGSIADVGGEVFLEVVQFQQERVIEAFVGHVRHDTLGVLTPQRDSGLGNVHPDDGVSVRSMPHKCSFVVIEAAASRCRVEKFVVDYEADFDSLDPRGLLLFVLEPLIESGKFAVVEVSSGDADAIDIATGLVERVVGQRAPQVDADEIPPENREEIGGHRLKKFGQIPRDILREVHFLRRNQPPRIAGRTCIDSPLFGCGYSFRSDKDLFFRVIPVSIPAADRLASARKSSL